MAGYKEWTSSVVVNSDTIVNLKANLESMM
jgi:hypothetical protein